MRAAEPARRCLIWILPCALIQGVVPSAVLADTTGSTQLKGSITIVESEFSDVLYGIVRHEVEEESSSAILRGAVIPNRNPYNSFPQQENMIAGQVVEPWTQEDTINAINLGLGILGGFSSSYGTGRGTVKTPIRTCPGGH